MTEDAPRPYYVTALDRIGLAILTGGVLAGLAAMPLAVAGGERSPAALGVAWAVVAALAMGSIVALLGPAWLLIHRRGLRGPGVAAATAGLLALVILTATQTLETSGGGYRLASAILTSLLPAIVAATIGAAMQRVAYRRLL